jgi:hypothetical protein
MFGVVGLVIVEATGLTAAEVREIADIHHPARPVRVLASASRFHEEPVRADPLGVGDGAGLVVAETSEYRGDFTGVTH